MVHNNRCEYAKGLVCRCECEGELHGIRDKTKEEEEQEEKERKEKKADPVWTDTKEVYCEFIPKEEEAKNVLNLMKWMEEEINNDKRTD